MFVMPNSITKSTKLNGNDKVVFSIIYSTNGIWNNKALFNIRGIAKKSGLSYRTTNRCINKLKRLKLIRFNRIKSMPTLTHIYTPYNHRKVE